MSRSPIRLGVNVDHVATIRQARGTDYPDPVVAALRAVEAGADGVTVHLREDRRHIQERDVRLLAQRLRQSDGSGDGWRVPLNLEMAVTDDMLALAEAVRPPRCCLVPEKREELTTEGGLDVAGNLERVSVAVQRLNAIGARTSLFIDPDDEQLAATLTTGAPAIEIHTGHYANASGDLATTMAAEIAAFAHKATQAGLEVHAGHGLHFDNVGPIAAIPEIVELNIGHFLIAQSIFDGIGPTVQAMAAAMRAAREA